MILSRDQQLRVEAALAAANARTSGEIVCVVAAAASDYAGVAASVQLQLVLIFLVVWGAGCFSHSSGLGDELRCFFVVAFPVLFLQAAATVLLGLAISAAPSLVRLTIPRSMRYAATRRLALEQFLALGLARNPSCAGVLIFASRAERYVHILADEGLRHGIDDKTWRESSRDLLHLVEQGKIAEGFVRAIETCGAVLAETFPQDWTASIPRARLVVLERPRSSADNHGPLGGGDGDPDGLCGASACDGGADGDGDGGDGGDGGGDGGG